MALKSIIDKETFEKLPEPVQAEYKAGEEGKYVLDIAGLEEHPQAGALKRAKDRLKDELDEAKKEKTEAEKTFKAEKEKLEGKVKELEESGEKGPDIEKLRTEYEQKLEKLTNDHKTEVEKHQGHVKDLLVGEQAQSLAKEWSTVPSLMRPELERRLTVEYNSDGKPETRILDKDGKVSAMSMEDLKAEVYANKEFEPILVGSRADGSSAPGDRGGSGEGGSAPSGGNNFGQDPAALSDADLAKRVTSKMTNQGVI